MLEKIKTYSRYISEYIKHREYRYILSILKFEILGLPSSHTAYFRSSLGLFHIRGGTIDFKFANYAYEWGVKQFFLDHYRDYSVFLDIGANIGIYSIMMAKSGLRCHAFEPMSENFRALVENIELNHLADVITPHSVALGSENAIRQFTYEKINTGASRLEGNPSDYHGPEGSHVSVPATVRRLDDVLSGDLIDPSASVLIKIDAEGMELLILDGATEFLKRHPRILLVMEKKYQELDKITECLSRSGNYQALPVDDWNMAFLKLPDVHK